MTRSIDYIGFELTKVWQDRNHPIVLTRPKFLKQKPGEHMQNNPVIAEIVGEQENYLCRAGGLSYQEKGYLSIDYI